MLDFTRSVTVAIVGAASLSLLVGCSGGSSESGATTRQRSSMLTVTAVPGGAYAVANPITLLGGTLDLQTALFSLDRVVIEENTGEDHGEHGQHDSEGEGEEEGGEGPEGGESDSEDIVIAGPFSIDIATGGAVLGSVPVFPGTFRTADLVFRLDGTPPLSGDSIYVAGTWRPSGGGSIPFTLRSGFLEQTQVMIANGGIRVGASAIVPIALTFDLAALFGNLDLATAAVVNGEIVIDETNNAHLLAAFETNLVGFVECEHEEDH